MGLESNYFRIMEANEQKDEKKGMSYFFDFSEVWGYYFRKKDPSRKPDLNLRMMHGINKIAIVMFLFAVLYMAYKFIFVY